MAWLDSWGLRTPLRGGVFQIRNTTHMARLHEILSGEARDSPSVDTDASAETDAEVRGRGSSESPTASAEADAEVTGRETEVSRHEQLLRHDEDRQYTDGESTAEEVDPKRLFLEPTLNDVRWYYDETWASVLIEKPIEDAFKHGFTIEGNDELDRLLQMFSAKFITAHIKARRDGFAVLWWRFRDEADTAEPPENAEELVDAKVLSVDRLTDSTPADFDEQLPEGYSHSQGDVTVTDHGIVISRDVDDLERFDEPLGYLYDLGENYGAQFIHADRTHHVAWRRRTDGSYDSSEGQDRSWGEWEGDPILMRVIHLLRAIYKGNWATMQMLWRHSTGLYKMSVPEGAGNDDYDRAEHVVQNINAKSGVVEPPNFELDQLDAAGSVDELRDSFGVIFDQVCAATEFTKSVLFGTQSGTVSGSETDIKNYFNKVHRIRETRFEGEFHQIANTFVDAGLIDDDDHETEWGPIFKLDRLDRAEAMRTQVNMVSQGVSNYVVTPDEARSLLSEEWAEWTESELDELTEREFDQLDRVNVNRMQSSQNGNGEESELEEGNPRVGQNGGGREGTGGGSQSPDS